MLSKLGELSFKILGDLHMLDLGNVRLMATWVP